VGYCQDVHAAVDMRVSRDGCTGFGRHYIAKVMDSTASSTSTVTTCMLEKGDCTKPLIKVEKDSTAISDHYSKPVEAACILPWSSSSRNGRMLGGRPFPCHVSHSKTANLRMYIARVTLDDMCKTQTTTSKSASIARARLEEPPPISCFPNNCSTYTSHSFAHCFLPSQWLS
jgi:hypothetical protein